jgi:hypothetical protein
MVIEVLSSTRDKAMIPSLIPKETLKASFGVRYRLLLAPQSNERELSPRLEVKA